MEPKDIEQQVTYYSEKTNFLDLEQFIQDTLGSKSVEELKPVMEEIKEETKHVGMGSTTEKNLEQCRTFLLGKNLDTQDPSYAIDISTVRVLKMLPGINLLRQAEYAEEYAVGVFHALIQQFILPKDEEYIRMPVNIPGKVRTLDQHMREEESPFNIQRHISRKEMGNVLVNIRNIFNQYTQKYS